MPEINVIRYEVRPHEPFGSEEYDPGSDLLVVVHSNPNDPSDPGEYAHHIRLQGLAYRKEMWGLSEYAEVIDTELKDLERFYFRDPKVDYGPHPLAEITEHYYTGPRAHMQTFDPNYVIDRIPSAIPFSTDGQVEFARDVVLTALDDVRTCLGSVDQKTFPCKGMTGLSTESREKRSRSNQRMREHGRQARLKSGKGLDGVRQYLTDRASELEPVRSQFVDRALVDSDVPGLMMKQARTAVARRGPRK